MPISLSRTSIYSALSPLGRTMETPKGIFYWSSRAKAEAKIDGTIGIAQDDDGTISHLHAAEKWVGESVMQRVPKGKIFGYAPIEGLPSLRKKWFDYEFKSFPELKKNALLPVVHNGITHCLAVAGRLFLEKGQTIVIAEKSWENYEHIFSDVQGIKISTYQMFNESGLNVSGAINALKQVAMREGKGILLLNFPHNQTGYSPTPAESEEFGCQLENLCNEMAAASFVVILDDAYEGYVYDGIGQKFSIAGQIFRRVPNLTVLKLSGISKAMLAYGYRVAFTTCLVNSLDGSSFIDEDLKNLNAEIGSKIGGFIRGEISQVNHHGQVLADALMDNVDEMERDKAETVDMLARRWKVFMNAFEEGYKAYKKEKLWLDPCRGGFFGFVNIADGIDAKKVADRLLVEKGIGAVPSEKGLRLAFCGVDEAKIPIMVKGIFEIVYSF